MIHSWAKRAVPTAMAVILFVVATYAVLRAYEAVFKGTPNPALVIGSSKIAMFWRLGVGGYVAGMVAVLVFFATARRFDLTLKAVALALPIVAALITIQGIFLP